jgi:hypothetical protein
MLMLPSESCLMLLLHDMRAAASRTFCTAGSSRPMRMAMMAMTTSNSISVKPRQRLSLRKSGTTASPGEEERQGRNNAPNDERNQRWERTCRKGRL